MSAPGRGDRVSVYHDPITMNEIEAVDVKILKDEGHVGFVEGREMRRYRVRLPGLGVVERNVLLPEVTIQLPVSEESFGRWLEDNRAHVSISCSLGTYNVTINYHKLDAYREEGNTSVRRSIDTEVSVYDKSFEKAFSDAMARKVTP